MNIATYGNIGMAFIWIGGIVLVASAFLFFGMFRGISIGSPDGIHSHDTYYIMLMGWQRLFPLLPLVAGLLLMFTGYIVRSHAHGLASVVEEFEETVPEATPDE